jgi:hypothetical protein
MIGFTWRQFRTQTWVTVGALAALGVVLVITGRSIADADANVAACDSDCAGAINNFLHQVTTSTSGTVYDLANTILYVVPALIGIFWGAPLLARELETGTHRLAWNQSVTRTRWLATKLAIGAVRRQRHRPDRLRAVRVHPRRHRRHAHPPHRPCHGRHPRHLRRRRHLHAGMDPGTPGTRQPRHQPLGHLITEHADDRQGNELTVVASNNLPDAWVLSNQTITATGQVFTGPANPQYCGPDTAPQVCTDWVGSLGLRQDLIYHPANHFWPPAMDRSRHLFAIAVLLAGFCFWWTRRRLT